MVRRRWKLKSKSPQEEPQQQQLKLPELELAVVVRILKDCYGVFLEHVPENKRAYYVRFRQLQTDRTVQGMTHAKGTKVSPIFLRQILDRFEIKLPDFLEDMMATTKKGPQPV